MECPWRREAPNIKTRAPARRATRAVGAMALLSHHQACETSARAARSQRQHYHHHHQGHHHGHHHCCSPSPPPANLKSLRVLLSLVVLLVTWTSLLGTATAQQHSGADHRRSLPPPDSLNADPAWKPPSRLVLDTRPPPVAPLMHLYRRQDEEGATATTSAASSTTASIQTDPGATPSDFSVPQPFDTALSNNFTANCATFFRQFMVNDDFQQCHPFSLLLQTSSGFFDASRSYVRITQTLEATCNANVTTCTGTMNRMARELIADNNCAVDYKNDNPQVLQAYNGLLAYEPLYQASCLRDDEGSYCYANAVTNSTATSDSYPYYLPLGVPLPGGARPTCNGCLQDAMAIFSSFAGNSTQPVSKTYNGGAQLIGMVCGTNFVNQTATPMKGAASATAATFTPTITLLLMLLVYLFP